MTDELAAILAQIRIELAGEWPMKRARVVVRGYSRGAYQRPIPDGPERFRHLTRHLEQPDSSGIGSH